MMIVSSNGADAYQVWLKARSAVTAASYPSRLDYTIVVTGFDGTAFETNHYRASFDTDGGTIRVFPISDEQLAAPPPVPHGVNVFFSIDNVISLPIGHPVPTLDLFGVPLLTPTYMFGMLYRRAAGTASHAPGPPLPIIATVSSRSPDYRVRLIDAPTLGGTPTFHLGLTPLRRPKENRLRELWIGAGDYLPRKAIVSGNFTVRPLVDVSWTIDFSIANGAPYIARETADATLYMPHWRVVADAAIAFRHVREPTGIYDEPLVAPDVPDALVEPTV